MIELAALAVDVDAVSVRLAIDLVVVAALAFGLSYRRHGRRDLVVLQVVFNVGLFAAVIVISAGEVAAAVGFGLFAVLSIIRLRAETLANVDIAYFFAAIVVGLVAAVDLGNPLGNAGLAALVLASAALVDHPRLLHDHQRVDFSLELAEADPAALQRLVEQRTGGRAVALEVLEVDYVREITRVRALVRSGSGA
ncbi:MAG TPA: DUF4956 domain-containing protein [Solirubrobacteraceae bacterium]|nr:DUF4956 domain-containing protein [Solirubrobacteraceae bacterium]